MSFFDAYPQNILDYFQMIPDRSVTGILRKDRAKIVAVSKDNKSYEDASKDMSELDIMYSFEMVDVSNGYLKMVGAMEGHLKMCYWNLKNGYKMISVYQEGCDPECEVAGFDFYIFDGDMYKNVPYEEIIPDIYNDFFLTDTNSSRTVQVIKAEMGKKNISATLLFDLPQKGKDIIAKWGNSEDNQVYKEFAVGNRMLLKWNDGKFEKAKYFGVNN
ncbi:MAG: hypothetical protein PHR81_02490 [Bacteroidales bacterium]|jgi:hypothetical protein|nr:hypothetical protein [Bacteroidales bacterium]MDD4213659.1 hypothetical protein [Bacteroidales bacterium]